MNSKLRCDSVFTQLTNEQIEVLEDWLFEEKLGYKEVLEKARQDWGLKTSLTSLGRFYRRLALQRTEEQRLETVALCLESLAAKEDGTLQAGLLALANQRAVEFLVEAPRSMRDFTSLLRALTSAQAQEMKRIEFRREEDARKQREIERKEKEEADRVMKERWAQEAKEFRIKREEKRLAKLAAKKAEEEAKANEANAVQVPAEPERKIAAGLVAEESPVKAEPVVAETALAPISTAVSEGPVEGREFEKFERPTGLEETEEFTINWAGNTP